MGWNRAHPHRGGTSESQARTYLPPLQFSRPGSGARSPRRLRPWLSRQGWRERQVRGITRICCFPTERILRLCRNRRSCGHVRALGVATPVCFALWIPKGAEHVGWAVAPFLPPLSASFCFSSFFSPILHFCLGIPSVGLAT